MLNSLFYFLSLPGAFQDHNACYIQRTTQLRSKIMWIHGIYCIVEEGMSDERFNSKITGTYAFKDFMMTILEHEVPAVPRAPQVPTAPQVPPVPEVTPEVGQDVSYSSILQRYLVFNWYRWYCWYFGLVLSLYDGLSLHHRNIVQFAFQYVAAFVISAQASQLDRVGKPYNPLLGETYECNR